VDFGHFRACVLVVLAQAGHANHADAEPADCAAPQLHVELPPGSSWFERIEPLKEELQGARIDRCARVEIHLDGSEAVVSVESRGRTAQRRVSEPSELVRTVEALMVLPPLPDSTAPASPSERIPEEPPKAPLPLPEPTRVDLGLSASLRVGGTFYVGGGFAATADVVVNRFVLGIAGRWDIQDGYVAEPTASGFNMESGALGVLLGRRLQLRWATLDALVDGQIIVESQEENGPGDGLGGETLDTRFGLALRLFEARTVGFRPFVLADVEASPARVRHAKQLDPALPFLPSWTSGVSLGIMWSPQ
jgi:hypothetical protein